MALLLLIPTTTSPAHADCPAAPISDPDDMAISFLAANGVQAASASLLASTVKEGIVVYDDTNDTLKLCDGDNWIAVGSGFGTDTLASLSCAAGEIAKYNGTAWACATDGGGSGTTVGFLGTYSGVAIGTTVGDIAGYTQQRDDGGDNFNPTTGIFTAPVAGYYALNGQVNYANGGNSFASVIIQAAGASRCYSFESANSGNYYRGCAAVVYMTAGQTAKMQASANGGATTGAGEFSGSLIGGGADTLSGLSCSTNEIPKWNGTAWACATDGGGAGGDAASYLIKGISATQSGLAPGTVVASTTHVASAGSKITHSGNRITLAGGSRYMLRAFIRQGTAGAALDYLIFDVTNGANVPSATGSANANTNYSDTDATAFVAPSASTTYEIRVAAGGGSALSGYSYFSAVELGGGGSDTLSSLSCATNEIPKWNGSAWACATDGSDGGASMTGAVMAFNASACPSGWTEYLPARGRFLRGIDNGAGVDPAGTRAPGNTQADDIKAIPNAYLWNGPEYSGGMSSGGAFAGRQATQTPPPGWPTGTETRPKNVAVIFCQYNGTGGMGGDLPLQNSSNLK